MFTKIRLSLASVVYGRAYTQKVLLLIAVTSRSSRSEASVSSLILVACSCSNILPSSRIMAMSFKLIVSSSYQSFSRGFVFVILQSQVKSSRSRSTSAYKVLFSRRIDSNCKASSLTSYLHARALLVHYVQEGRMPSHYSFSISQAICRQQKLHLLLNVQANLLIFTFPC